MATKKTTTTTTTRRTVNGKSWLLRAASYFALIISAFMFLFGGIFSGTVRENLFLASEEADYITGCNYLVDGGRTIGPKNATWNI